MLPLPALWLPILVSAVLVFVASSAIHMVLPWHKSDYPRMPNEEKAMDALRPLAIPPGDYLVPCPGTRAEMRTPEFAEKLKKGPVMVMTVMENGPMPMGKNMVFWFLYCLVVSIFAGYSAGHAFGSSPRRIIRMAGVTAFAGYTLALWQLSIWYRRSLSTTAKATGDGAIYALITGAVFVWLWPH